MTVPLSKSSSNSPGCDHQARPVLLISRDFTFLLLCPACLHFCLIFSPISALLGTLHYATYPCCSPVPQPRADLCCLLISCWWPWIQVLDKGAVLRCSESSASTKGNLSGPVRKEAAGCKAKRQWWLLERKDYVGGVVWRGGRRKRKKKLVEKEGGRCSAHSAAYVTLLENQPFTKAPRHCHMCCQC